MTDYEKLYNLVYFIANDYVELSYEKVALQRDDYMKRARKVLAEIYTKDDYEVPFG